MADSGQLECGGGARGERQGIPSEAKTEAWRGSCKYREHELHKRIHDLIRPSRSTRNTSGTSSAQGGMPRSEASLSFSKTWPLGGELTRYAKHL